MEIDKGIKNTWKEAWLKEILPDGSMARDVFKKMPKPGIARCTLCSKDLNYAAEGLKTLKKHSKTQSHAKKLISIKGNQLLPGISPSSGAPANYPIFPSGKENTPAPPPKPMVSMADRIVYQEAMLLSFLAENSMPFTKSSELISLTKSLANDKKALNSLSMDRTSASYKTVFGIGKTFRESLLSSLKDSYFSLNMDESTSQTHEKIVTILVNYVTDNESPIVTEHLHSCSILKADSDTIFNVLVSFFEENSLSWTRLLSILMDSCNVMRGVKNGVETKIRLEKAPHLLDIDGDTCHHAHNAAKAFTKPFSVQKVFFAIYNDFKWTPEFRDYLSDICLMVGVKYTAPEKYIPHRWLTIYTVALDTLRLHDAFTLFYFSFLSKDDRKLYLHYVIEIERRRNISNDSKSRLTEIQSALSSKKMTTDGLERKRKILEFLFIQRKAYLSELYIYESVLPALQSFIKLFQTSAPMIHVLHDEIVSLFRQFLAYFIKPQFIPVSIKQLTTLDCSDKSIMLRQSDWFIGNKAKSLVSSSKEYLRKSFFSKVETAFIECAQYLQKTMPIDSTALQVLSALDPSAAGQSASLKLMLQISSLAPTMVTEDQKDSFNLEVRRFHVDALPDFDSKLQRIDIWWKSLSATGKYPLLCKTSLSLLTCFHGPKVESTFSEMNDVMDAQSSRMNIATLDALHTIRYRLKSQSKPSYKYFARKDPAYDAIDASLCGNFRLASQNRRKEQEHHRRILAEKKSTLNLHSLDVLSKAASKKMSSKIVKRALKKHTSSLAKRAKISN